MSRPETLVILTPAFPANEAETHWVPTQQLFVKKLKDNFPQLQVIVLTFYYPGHAVSYQWHGLQVIGFDGTQKRKLRRVFFWNDVWKQLNRLRRENNIIGLFSFWCGECALLGSYFGRRHGIKHYCWLCGQDARAGNKLVKFIRPRPGELIAMSDFLLREFYTNHGIRPGHMIPNAIDPQLFPPMPVAARDIDILGAGSLSPLKRYDLFVEIIKALQTLFPSIKARHCGEGGDRKKIQDLTEQLGLSANFSLLGEKPYPEVLGLMQRSKILLHTSSYEGFGIVCLEALYAGAHVISFCKPLDRGIPHWHIVNTAEEMIAKAAALLRDPATSCTPVLPYTMDDTVKAVMALFDITPQQQQENARKDDNS